MCFCITILLSFRVSSNFSFSLPALIFFVVFTGKCFQRNHATHSNRFLALPKRHHHDFDECVSLVSTHHRLALTNRISKLSISSTMASRLMLNIRDPRLHSNYQTPSDHAGHSTRLIFTSIIDTEINYDLYSRNHPEQRDGYIDMNVMSNATSAEGMPPTTYV